MTGPHDEHRGDVTDERFADQLAEYTFLADLSRLHLERLAACASSTYLSEGDQIFREGDYADGFYLIREGEVSLELRLPNRGPVVVQTLHQGDILGWSWLFPPYRWHFDARSLTPVLAIGFDAACIRRACDDDHELGYFLMKRFAQVMIERLQRSRLQMLDLYQKG